MVAWTTEKSDIFVTFRRQTSLDNREKRYFYHFPKADKLGQQRKAIFLSLSEGRQNAFRLSTFLTQHHFKYWYKIHQPIFPLSLKTRKWGTNYFCLNKCSLSEMGRVQENLRSQIRTAVLRTVLHGDHPRGADRAVVIAHVILSRVQGAQDTGLQAPQTPVRAFGAFCNSKNFSNFLPSPAIKI